MTTDQGQIGEELLEEGLVPLSPLPDDHFPADHDEYVRAVDRDLAARKRRRRKIAAGDA